MSADLSRYIAPRAAKKFRERKPEPERPRAAFLHAREPEQLEPPRRVPAGRVFGAEPGSEEIRARELLIARGEELARERERRLLELMPVQTFGDGILRLTGAPKPPEAAPVPDTAVKPAMVARYRALEPRPSGGLKLTGAQGGAYWFRDLVGTRGSSNRFKGSKWSWK